jgi:hypothetical protein
MDIIARLRTANDVTLFLTVHLAAYVAHPQKL